MMYIRSRCLLIGIVFSLLINPFLPLTQLYALVPEKDFQEAVAKAKQAAQETLKTEGERGELSERPIPHLATIVNQTMQKIEQTIAKNTAITKPYQDQIERLKQQFGKEKDPALRNNIVNEIAHWQELASAAQKIHRARHYEIAITLLRKIDYPTMQSIANELERRINPAQELEKARADQAAARQKIIVLNKLDTTAKILEQADKDFQMIVEQQAQLSSYEAKSIPEFINEVRITLAGVPDRQAILAEIQNNIPVSQTLSTLLRELNELSDRWDLLKDYQGSVAQAVKKDGNVAALNKSNVGQDIKDQKALAQQIQRSNRQFYDLLGASAYVGGLIVLLFLTVGFPIIILVTQHKKDNSNLNKCLRGEFTSNPNMYDWQHCEKLACTYGGTFLGASEKNCTQWKCATGQLTPAQCGKAPTPEPTQSAPLPEPISPEPEPVFPPESPIIQPTPQPWVPLSPVEIVSPLAQPVPPIVPKTDEQILLSMLSGNLTSLQAVGKVIQLFDEHGWWNRNDLISTVVNTFMNQSKYKFFHQGGNPHSLSAFDVVALFNRPEFTNWLITNFIPNVSLARPLSQPAASYQSDLNRWIITTIMVLCQPLSYARDPVDVVLRQNYPSLLSAIFASKVITPDSIDFTNETLLAYALEHKSVPVVKLLLEGGANPRRKVFDMPGAGPARMWATVPRDLAKDNPELLALIDQYLNPQIPRPQSLVQESIP